MEESIEYKGYTIRIAQDDCGVNENPDEWGDGEVFLIAQIRGYLEIERKGFMEPVKGINLTVEGKKYHVFPLFAYVHGGVALSIARNYPFDCPWDSGQAGYVYVSYDETEDRNVAHKLAEGLVETWNHCLSGNVWGYIITKPNVCPTCDHDEPEDVDSCWGFIGDIDYCLEEAKSVVDSFVKQEELKEKINQAENSQQEEIRQGIFNAWVDRNR